MAIRHEEGFLEFQKAIIRSVTLSELSKRGTSIITLLLLSLFSIDYLPGTSPCLPLTLPEG